MTKNSEQLLAEYRRLADEAAALRVELRGEWLNLSIQRVREIERRLQQIDARLGALRRLKSVAGQITGS